MVLGALGRPAELGRRALRLPGGRQRERRGPHAGFGFGARPSLAGHALLPRPPPCPSQLSAALLRPQEADSGRAAPITLTASRGQGRALWIDASPRTAQAGMAGVGTALAHAKPWGVPTETLQGKGRAPEAMKWFESTSPPATGRPALGSGFRPASTGPALGSRGCPSHPPPALGHAEKMKTVSQAECLTPAFMPSRWSCHTHGTIGTPQQRLHVCLRSPVTVGL